MGFVYKDEVVIELLSHRQGLTIILQPLVTGPVTWGRGLQVLSQGGAWGSQGGGLNWVLEVLSEGGVLGSVP